MADEKKCPCCRKTRTWDEFVRGDKRCAFCRGERQPVPEPKDLQRAEDSFDVGPALDTTQAPRALRGNDHLAELVIAELLDRAKTAKLDLKDFLELCIRAERTRACLEVCPHQELIIRFIEKHRKCVIRTPVNTHKTYTVGSWIIWKLGQDPTLTGAVASRTLEMSQKVLTFVKDYLSDPQLGDGVRLVFPALRPGRVWHEHKITVERAAGTRDFSVVALGDGSGKQGARYDWAIVDDVCSDANTITEEARSKTHGFVFHDVITRLNNPENGIVVVVGTPWHVDDVSYRLENARWPTLTMNIYGEVKVSNCDMEDFADFVVPSPRTKGWYVFRHLADLPLEEHTICPHVYPPRVIREFEKTVRPLDFARAYMCVPYAEGDMRCQPEWTRRCQQRGLREGYHRFVDEYRGPNPVYTAVDLSIGKTGQRSGGASDFGASHDRTCIFTFELLPDKSRRILKISTGRWTGPQILDEIDKHYRAFGGIVVVESVSAQTYLLQFLGDPKRTGDREYATRIRAHNTRPENKHNTDFGVESLFVEIENGLWIFPTELDGTSSPEVEELIQDLTIRYRREAHTPDRIMAMWIGREAARKGGFRDPKPRGGGRMAMASTGGF